MLICIEIAIVIDVVSCPYKTQSQNEDKIFNIQRPGSNLDKFAMNLELFNDKVEPFAISFGCIVICVMHILDIYCLACLNISFMMRFTVQE